MSNMPIAGIAAAAMALQPTPDLELRSVDAHGSLLVRLARNYC
jgi:hypothetical protein